MQKDAGRVWFSDVSRAITLAVEVRKIYLSGRDDSGMEKELVCRRPILSWNDGA